MVQRAKAPDANSDDLNSLIPGTPMVEEEN